MKAASVIALVTAALAPAVISSAASDCTAKRYTGYVDPFIGTAGHGHVFLGANVPFGLVQLGPSQAVKGWDWCSGYHYSDSTLLGFSHIHLSGTGIGDLGDLLMLPVVNPADTAASFNHREEQCRPGYYRVRLGNSGVVAELTATQRCGYHRYTFPTATDSTYVKVNLDYGIGWDRPEGTSVELVNDTTLGGYRCSAGWARDQRIYFTARFSRPVASCAGDSGNVTLAFAPSAEPLMIKVGVSPVSIENAIGNLEAEDGGRDFDAVRAAADDAWNAQLAKVMVESSSTADLVKFYTALYHTMFAPIVFSDANGDYRGADGAIHSTGLRFTNYSVFSLWDTYRAAHPLATILHPGMQADYAATFINIYRQQGKLPVWHLHGNETDCMVGNPGVIVLGDLVAKGFVTDTVAAYGAMRASCMGDERSLDALKHYGYIPFDAPGCAESVAKGLEYAVADGAVARVAAMLGRDEDASYFGLRAQSYRRYFDPASGFMRGKSADGLFRSGEFNPFAATHRADDYCEGNAWQYIWLVPHDPHGLIGLFESEGQFISKLDSLFTVQGSLGDEASPDISGLIGQYAHGNEPGHHTVYLYNYAGVPHKAAPILRGIFADLYGDTPGGLCGNEDVGQMSAWLVLSSMGLYQVEPTGGKYVFGTPLFDKVSIQVGDGKTFDIVARGNSPENIYIQRVSLDGKPYGKSYIGYDRIMQGGTLEFTMGREPSPTYGTDTDARP